MASADHTRGNMDISSQEATWRGFLKGSVWGSMIVSLLVAYLVLAIPLGLHWFIALVLCAGAGIVGGMLMGMGGAWIATVVGLAGLAIIVQILIGVFGLLL